MAQIRQLGTALSGSLTGTEDREQHQGSGSPEGVVTGNVGDLYRDLTTPALYLKTSGTGSNAGWEAVSGGGSSGTEIHDGDASVSTDAAPLVTITDAAGTITLDGSDITIAADPAGGVNISGDQVQLAGTDGTVTVSDGHADMQGPEIALDTTGPPNFVTIGSAASNVGFYATTPVAQHASIDNATTAVDIIPLFNTLLDALRDLGLIADLP